MKPKWKTGFRRRHIKPHPSGKEPLHFPFGYINHGGMGVEAPKAPGR